MHKSIVINTQIYNILKNKYKDTGIFINTLAKKSVMEYLNGIKNIDELRRDLRINKLLSLKRKIFKKLKIKKCKYCKKEFISSKNNLIYCSKECYNKYYFKYKIEFCLTCGKKLNNLKRKYCSTHCFNMSEYKKNKLSRCISSSIYQSIKKNKNGRKWEELVDYSTNELKEHLIKTIPENFTWKDYEEGKLQIDHIIPKSLFTFSSYEDENFKKCWNKRNLRLIASNYNRKKWKYLNFEEVEKYKIEDLLPEGIYKNEKK